MSGGGYKFKGMLVFNLGRYVPICVLMGMILLRKGQLIGVIMYIWA